MMIAVNAPPLHSALISLPPSHLLEKREKPCAWIYPSFYKKSVYRWTIWASIILSPSVTKNMWCIAVLGVRIMGSDHYCDKKFIFPGFGLGVPRKLWHICLELPPFYWQFWDFYRYRSSTAGSCKAASFFMCRGGTKANDVNDYRL